MGSLLSANLRTTEIGTLFEGRARGLKPKQAPSKRGFVTHLYINCDTTSCTIITVGLTALKVAQCLWDDNLSERKPCLAGQHSRVMCLFNAGALESIWCKQSVLVPLNTLDKGTKRS